METTLYEVERERRRRMETTLYEVERERRRMETMLYEAERERKTLYEIERERRRMETTLYEVERERRKMETILYEAETERIALYEAAVLGNTHKLLDLVHQNEDILNRVTAAGLKEESILHIAAQFGYVDFVTEILNRRPEYVRDLNSQGQPPLHLAAERGHLNVVEVLLEKDAGICFFRDKDGRTPLHLAALRGRLEVVEEIVLEKPATAWMLTNDGEPILHLCAKNNQFGAVKKLVELVNEEKFLNMKDNEDNTILHILVAKKQKKVISDLVVNGLDINIKNVYGSTAFDDSLENTTGLDSWDIKLNLIGAGAKIERERRSRRPDNTKPKMVTENYRNIMYNEGLLVLAILMASVAFQAGLNPPGGVWQDTGYHNETTLSPTGALCSEKLVLHYVGQSVMSYTNKGSYIVFCICNSITLLSSLVLIGLLVSGFNFDDWFSRWTLIFMTIVSASSMLIAYQAGMLLLSKDQALIAVSWVTFPSNITGVLQLISILFCINFVRQVIIPRTYAFFFKCIFWYLKFIALLDSLMTCRSKM